MENVWKKETSETHASYVNLFASIPVDGDLNRQVELASLTRRVKDKRLAEWEMRSADARFEADRFFDAMNLYTSSLCFAKFGDECFPSAFAKRSACFHALEMLMEASVDIELALDAGLPDKQQLQLKQIRENCLPWISASPQRSTSTPILSYAAKKDFPGLANVVDVNYDAHFGRHLVANTDIPQGKVIITEEAFAVNYMADTSRCYTCFHKYKNFIPCEECVYAVFCNLECKNRNQTHALECDTFFGILEDSTDIINRHEWLEIKLIIQTVLNALSTFPNVKKLMEFVENALLEDPDQLPTSMDSTTSKYHFFFKLKRIAEKNILIRARHAYKLTMKLPKVRALFDTHKKQCFLMHLIAHHTSITSANSSRNQSGTNIGYFESLLNHSCEPNVKSSAALSVIVIETKRPVKKGEQLFHSYFPNDVNRQSREVRQRILYDSFGFICKCSKCESE